MNFVQTIRRGSHLVDAIDAEIVTIGIVRNAMARPTHLIARTATHRDPVIYWDSGSPANAAPDATPYAREVVWTTVDLLAGETLRIEPRPGQDGFFNWDSFELDDQHSVVSTGPVSMNTVLGPRQAWAYEIVLDSPRLTRLLALECVVMIAEEP
jgi:hypothetical protein